MSYDSVYPTPIRVSVHVFADPHGEALSRIRRHLTVGRLFEITDRFTSQIGTSGPAFRFTSV